MKFFMQVSRASSGTSFLSMYHRHKTSNSGVCEIKSRPFLHSDIAAASAPGLEGNENMDFSDVCRHYLGRWAEILSVIFSLIALLGGAIVYWVLMSNFLFHTVTFIHGQCFTWSFASAACYGILVLYYLWLGLYRISALAGIRHFFQIRQKSGSGKNPTGAG